MRSLTGRPRVKGGSAWRELRALVRGPIKTYMHQDRRPARAPPGPQHINFWGWERATPARSAAWGALFPDDSNRRSTRARDQALGRTWNGCGFGCIRWRISGVRTSDVVESPVASKRALVCAWSRFWFNWPGMHNLVRCASAH